MLKDYLKNEALAEKRSFGGNCEILRTNLCRGHYPPIYQQAGKGFIYFITQQIISQGEHAEIVLAYLVEFFVFLCVEFSTSLSVSPSLASAESILSFSKTN